MNNGSSLEDEQQDTILNYIASLGMKETLYEDVFTSVSVFRSLPVLAKHIVMRMLWLGSGLNVAVVKQWVKKVPATPEAKDNVKANGNNGTHSALSEAINRLVRLNLMRLENEQLLMDPNFRTSIQRFVTNDTPNTGINDISVDKNMPSLDKISAHARDSWERMLQLLVDDDPSLRQSHDTKNKDTKRVEKILEFAEYIVQDPSSEEIAITSKGFRFLFLPHRKQVWAFLLGYVRYVSHLKEVRLNEQEVLRFLFRLSHLSVGQGYPTKQLTEAERQVLLHLRGFGLVFLKRDSSKRYYPTALAMSLSSTENTLSSTLGQTHGKIIVETTFRLVAYTDSSFQIKILNKFVRLDYRLPNLIVGVITKHSVMEALRNGITAEGIIMYLEQHAHPQMKRNLKTGRALPPTVAEQLRLWQKERERFTVTKSHLLTDFESDDKYRRILELMQAEGTLQWQNDEKQLLAVTPEGFEKVRKVQQEERRRSQR